MSFDEIIEGGRCSRGKSWERGCLPPNSPCPRCGTLERVRLHQPETLGPFRGHEEGEGQRFVRKVCDECHTMWPEFMPDAWQKLGFRTLVAGIPPDVYEGLRLTAASGPASLSQIVERALRAALPTPLPTVPHASTTNLIHWQQDPENETP